MEKLQLITAEDKIYDLVQRYPQLRTVLPEISAKFNRLNNPLVFNTVARVTTVRTAAGVGQIYLREMLFQLNEAIGLGRDYLEQEKKTVGALKESFLKARSASSAQEKPLWLKYGGDWTVRDVRDSGKDPFEELSNLSQSTPAGSGFILIQKFLPLPLLNYLKLQGFDSYSEKISDQEFHIWFYHTKEEKE